MHDDTYWQAVLEHNSNFDGAFVYAVRSTGVYCKPSCPSRRPGREQVRFFTLPIEAQEAGFRPCRRCQIVETNNEHAEVIQQLCHYIEEHSDEPLTLTILSEQVHLSPTYLQRVFKQKMGVTPYQYLQSCRMTRLKAQLQEGAAISGALYTVGYGSSSRLYERAATHLGMTPGTYRQHGKDMQMTYTIVSCSLGRLLVAATTKGVSAVSLGENDTELETALRKEYSAATITQNTDTMRQWVQDILHYIEGTRTQLDLPLDIQATAFQRQVWQALRAIPYGETRSYAEIAQTLGDVHKARAVAQACAANPVALVIPCHRVVRGNGSLGGYRWGIERKKHLLDQEMTK